MKTLAVIMQSAAQIAMLQFERIFGFLTFIENKSFYFTNTTKHLHDSGYRGQPYKVQVSHHPSQQSHITAPNFASPIAKTPNYAPRCLTLRKTKLQSISALSSSSLIVSDVGMRVNICQRRFGRMDRVCFPHCE